MIVVPAGNEPVWAEEDLVSLIVDVESVATRTLMIRSLLL